MKKGIVLWILTLALGLTACGQSGETQPEEVAPTPEIQAPEQSGETLSLPRRIMSEEALEYTNREDCANGFVLAEREEDGVPFLEFTRPETPDFSLRINQDLTEAVAKYQGRSMTLERVETPNGALLVCLRGLRRAGVRVQYAFLGGFHRGRAAGAGLAAARIWNRLSRERLYGLQHQWPGGDHFPCGAMGGNGRLHHRRAPGLGGRLYSRSCDGQ